MKYFTATLFLLSLISCGGGGDDSTDATTSSVPLSAEPTSVPTIIGLPSGINVVAHQDERSDKDEHGH